MQLRVLSYQDCEQARIWRNDNMSMNRTPYLLTPEMQGKFYHEQVCNRNANARYWGIWKDEVFIGMGEISNIQWENRLGEIGLLMHPEHIGDSTLAIEMILEQGFNHLNLENVFGESYLCNPRLSIWEMVSKRFNANSCYLPCRKFWEGKYYDSIHFTINKGDWKYGR